MVALKLTGLFLCSLGFFYQAGQLCLTYFSYPSGSSVVLTSSPYLDIPSFSYCMLHFSLNVNETIAQINARMVPRARLLQCTLDLPDHGHSGGQNGCQSRFHVVTKVYEGTWCLQYQNGGSKALRSLALGNGLVAMNIKRHALTKYGLIYLHSTDLTISYRNQLMAVQDGYHLLNFKKLKVERLPAPYSSKCRNYRQDGYLSAGHCVDECVVRRTMQKFQKWPLKVAAAGQLNITMSKADSRMDLTHCSRRCKAADCHVDSYMTDSTFFSIPENTYTRVEIKVSPEFDIELTESAKFELIELICYLAGLLTFWFGGSVLTISSGLLAKFKFGAKTGLESLARVWSFSK
ncbi:hypothetical protein HDE_05710 [Halotydeus destructor]|nr:hypothetical protein HDE_05710 [Halotydeus destructor]